MTDKDLEWWLQKRKPTNPKKNEPEDNAGNQATWAFHCQDVSPAIGSGDGRIVRKRLSD